jgi:hypothetical protein
MWFPIRLMIIFYRGCPVSWASKIQSQIALSTTEAEYIAMSQALRDVILIMNLLLGMREQNFKVICIKPYVYCKVFEDKAGALECARLPKPNTSMFAMIIFVNMCKRGSSRSSLSSSKIRLLMHSQKLWPKMTSNVINATCAISNLSKPPK